MASISSVKPMRGASPRIFTWLRPALFGLVAHLPGGQPASAETLSQAVDAAFQYNPALAAVEAHQRVLNEQVPIARADGLPNLSATSTLVQNFEPEENAYSSPVKAGTGVLNFSIPLYSGGTVKHAIKAAQWNIEQGKDTLRAADITLIINVVSAYMQVLAARSTLEIDQQYVSELEQSLTATRKRYAAGELTKTDIAQTETTLASARVTSLAAAASLRTAEEQFEYYVGHRPVELAAPPPLPDLPESEDEAVDVAMKSNPDLAAAQKAIRAARENTRSAIGARLPKLQIFAAGNYANYLGTAQSVYYGNAIQQVYTSGQVGVQLVLPLYQGGKPSAQIRSARDQEWAADGSELDTQNAVATQTRSDFVQWQALGSELVVAKDQVRAAQDAYVGVRKLNLLGDRTVQDVLNADQAVLAAKSQLVQVDANRYIAAIELLGKMGALSLGTIGSVGPIYDADVDERRANRSVFDWNDSAIRKSVRTVGNTQR